MPPAPLGWYLLYLHICVNFSSSCKYQLSGMYYNNRMYKNAMTKEEVCEAATKGDVSVNGTKVEVIMILD